MIWSHSTGLSIDVTLVNKSTGLELNFGTVFNYFNKKLLSNCDGNDLNEIQKINRIILIVFHHILPFYSTENKLRNRT